MSVSIVPRRRGKRVYYEEVESLRVNGKNTQVFIRYVGKDPNAPPNKFPLSPTHFGYLAIRLMEGQLAPNDVFDLLEQQGQRFSKESLAKIGIVYSFGEKTFCLYLYHPRKSNRRKDVQNAPRDLLDTKHGSEVRSRSKDRVR
jgi:hypothetical protein